MSIEQAKTSGVWDKIPESVRNQLVANKPARHNINPQKSLFDALLPIITEAEFEKQGLIPGRKFRADIYLPSSQIVIEVDGFKEHGMYKAKCLRQPWLCLVALLHGSDPEKSRRGTE